MMDLAEGHLAALDYAKARGPQGGNFVFNLGKSKEEEGVGRVAKGLTDSLLAAALLTYRLLTPRIPYTLHLT